MRVLWLSHLVPYPPKAGVLTRAHHLLRQTARRHEVHLLAFHQRDLVAPLFAKPEAGLAEAREALSGFCAGHAIFGIPSERGPFWQGRLALRSLAGAPYTIRWLHSAEFRRAVQEWTERIHPDLVHFDTISLVPYLGDVGGRPCILDHHNVESHLLLRRARGDRNPLRRIYYWQEGRRLEAWERRWCGRFALNLVCSDLDAKRLRSVCPRARTAVVPNPVDTDYFRPDPSAGEDPQRLIFVGTLSWKPNRDAVDFLAREIWPRLRRDLPKVTMDVVGAHPSRRLVELSRRDPGFRVHGFVDDIRPLMDTAAVYLCPVRDGGGTKLKILDAFAMKKAVVAHPRSCEGIAVTEGREVRLADTAEAYVAEVRDLLAHPSRRRAQGEAARELVERRYSVGFVGRELSDLYERCAFEPTPVSGAD